MIFLEIIKNFNIFFHYLNSKINLKIIYLFKIIYFLNNSIDDIVSIIGY